MFVLGSLRAVVDGDLVDLYDDVLGDFGFHWLAVSHMIEGYTLVIILCDRYLAKHLVFTGDNDADGITWYIFLPCA